MEDFEIKLLYKLDAKREQNGTVSPSFGIRRDNPTAVTEEQIET